MNILILYINDQTYSILINLIKDFMIIRLIIVV
jgi:hypothetical protein